MYFRKPMPVASSVYRTLDTRRYMMMPMGGFWPVIQKLPNGHLGVVTRDGDFHVGERGRLVFVTSPDGGESWSHATVISEDGRDNRNPALGARGGDGTLPAGGIARFYGTAEVHAADGEVREKVWNGMVEAERNGDPDKKGQAILIRITRAEQLNGKPLSEIGAG